MHVFSQFVSEAFANLLSQKYSGFASFRKYDFACFRKLSRKFANMVSQCLASFRKLSQFMVSQAFARIRKDSQMGFRKESQVRKSWFFARIRNGHFADAGGHWAWTLTVATGRVGAACRRSATVQSTHSGPAALRLHWRAPHWPA